MTMWFYGYYDPTAAPCVPLEAIRYIGSFPTAKPLQCEHYVKVGHWCDECGRVVT